jgi:hypothetical protein
MKTHCRSRADSACTHISGHALQHALCRFVMHGVVLYIQPHRVGSCWPYAVGLSVQASLINLCMCRQQVDRAVAYKVPCLHSHVLRPSPALEAKLHD